ncbi:MAG: hypothetical protein KGQ46_13800 [Hyphomicrobiales bacterium]|nr:hypothetical protein [Hyphomicrobiales bacterium]MDE2115062.1 hypothetical protein [Hyphomicrobiales bacterium]
MGWLTMTTLGRHATMPDYLDDQFTYERPDHRCKVLRSAMVGRTYYAAVEFIKIEPNELLVIALICQTSYHPRDREGYKYGYKDMDESAGPYESDCPASILDLLTPTDNANALQWRQICRDKIAKRRAITSKPTPKPGQTIIFDPPITFQNGLSFAQMNVIANPRRGPALYQAPDRSGIYRVSNIKRRNYRVIDPKVTELGLFCQ